MDITLRAYTFPPIFSLHNLTDAKEPTMNTNFNLNCFKKIKNVFPVPTVFRIFRSSRWKFLTRSGDDAPDDFSIFLSYQPSVQHSNSHFKVATSWIELKSHLDALIQCREYQWLVTHSLAGLGWLRFTQFRLLVTDNCFTKDYDLTTISLLLRLDMQIGCGNINGFYSS